MKDRKIFIIIVFIIILSGAFFFLSKPTVRQKQKRIIVNNETETESAQLREEVRKQRDSINSFEQMDTSLRNNLTIKERQLREEIERSQNLQAKIDELILQNNSLIEELSSTKESLSRLEKLTQPVRRRFEGLENALEEIKYSLITLGFSPEKEQDLKKQLASLKTQLGSIDRQLPGLIGGTKEYKVNEEGEIYREHTKTLENLLSEKEAQIQQLERRLKEGLIIDQEPQEYISTKSVFKNFRGLENTVEEISNSLAGLGFNLRKEKQLREQLASLKSELDSIDRELPNLIKENKSYRSQALILEDILTEKESQIENLENEIEQQRLNVKELNRIKKENSILEKKANNLKKKNSLLNERIARLEEKLETQRADKTIASLKKINQDLKDQVSLTKSELDKLNNDYVNLRNDYESLRATVAGSETELAKRSEMILDYRDRLGMAERKIDQLQRAADHEKQESATLRKRYVNRQLENETLRDQLDQYKQRLLNLQTQIVEATEENAVIQNRLKEQTCFGGNTFNLSPRGCSIPKHGARDVCSMAMRVAIIIRSAERHFAHYASLKIGVGFVNASVGYSDDLSSSCLRNDGVDSKVYFTVDAHDNSRDLVV